MKTGNDTATNQQSMSKSILHIELQRCYACGELLRITDDVRSKCAEKLDERLGLKPGPDSSWLCADCDRQFLQWYAALSESERTEMRARALAAVGVSQN